MISPCITITAKRRLPITACESMFGAAPNRWVLESHETRGHCLSVVGHHYTPIGDVQLDMWYDDRLGWTGLSSTKGALVRHEGLG